MICGYDIKELNEYGLEQMSEVSLAASPEALRQLAAFLIEAAEELEESTSEH